MELITWIPLTIASLIDATFAVIKMRHYGDVLYLLSAIAYILCCAAFTLLTISAHSDIFPHLDRASLAVYIRTLVFIGGLARCVLAVIQSNIEIERSHR